MNIFDGIIDEILKITAEYHQISYEYKIAKNFIEESNQFFFKNDIGIALGGEQKFGLSSTLVTSNLNYVKTDTITIIGKELSDLEKTTDYARIVIAEIDDSKYKSSNDIYQLVRKIDYARYHFNLKGVMLRASSMNKKESLIINKTSLKNEIKLQDIAEYMINIYKKNSAIKKVHLIFINQNNFPYNKLEDICEKSENITKALDHLANNIKMDCHSCSLQVVCNEVEKKVKEDFQ